MKVCKRCQQERPLGMFSPRKDAKDGLAYWCMPCKTAATTQGARRKEVVASYRLRNTETCKARALASVAKAPERYAERSREAQARYRAKNREAVLLRRRELYRQNVAAEIARVMLRKERTKVLHPWVTQAHLAEMNGMYLFCRIFPGFEVDHIVPLNGERVSGLHVPGNLQVLTVRANRQKGARFAGE